MLEYAWGHRKSIPRQTPRDIMADVLVRLANARDNRFWDYLDRVHSKFNEEELKSLMDIIFHNPIPIPTESEIRQATKKKKPDKEAEDVFAEV